MELAVIDEQMWAELKDIMEEDFGLLLETFLSDAEERLVCLGEAIDVMDAAALRESAHSFKGSCGNIGAMRLSSMASSLEQQVASIDWAVAKTSLVEMQREYLQVQQFIQQELPS
jgi:HPt (histidine-containing phosphotransfer) domain-containing protein